MVEEDSIETQDALGSEQSLLEISSKTGNQKEATKDDLDMQNMPGEDSPSAHLESDFGGAGTRYNSALDMTLKALFNIRILKEDLTNSIQAFQDHPEEQIPSALQKFFIAFVSGRIKTEEVYSRLLSDMYLQEILPMLNDVAKVVAAVLKFWHCWKYPENESLVICLFTVAENERMSCGKCRRITNYQEKSSYVLVIAAKSLDT